jgi:adenylosuccinate lyase
MNPLNALSPLDGRYASKIRPLTSYFSEYALIRYRVWVEVEYFIALHETGLAPLTPFSAGSQTRLRSLYEAFTETDASRVKEIEKVTNHDVKAVEYFIKESVQEWAEPEIMRNMEFIHFALTSQDINNTATPMMLRDGLHDVYLTELSGLIGQLQAGVDKWKRIPMLARTHGQPASPTTLGKEFAVFSERLLKQANELSQLPFPAKFGGATGNFNAHFAAYPAYDWPAFADRFVNDTLGLNRTRTTTQIEPYDGLGRIFDAIKRLNSVLTDLCQDVWLYVSMEYFRQKVVANEVGSSAMPHKVNPIDFENAEGNLGISTAMLEFMSRKLPVSRLQRDLTDSTILRNVGSAIGYSYLALTSVSKGLSKLLVNEARIRSDLNANWAVLAEAIQTILRREGYPNPYEALKSLTRGKDSIGQEELMDFVDELDVPEQVKSELRSLRPESYIGDAGL